MPEEIREIMVVERRPVQPLDGPDEQQLPRDGGTVGADDVDLDIIGSGPVPAESGRSRQGVVRQAPGQPFSDEAPLLDLAKTAKPNGCA